VRPRRLDRALSIRKFSRDIVGKHADVGCRPSLSEDDLRAVIAFAAASAAEDLPAPSPVPPNAKVA